MALGWKRSGMRWLGISMEGAGSWWRNPNGARALKGKQVGNTEAVAKLKASADQRAADLKAIVDDIKRSGITTVRGIAEELHVRGIRAPRGDTWHPTAVSRLLSRISP